MGKQEKIYMHIMLRMGDANVPFSGLCSLLKHFGFSLRTSGDHHIFTKDEVDEILNLQPKGKKAKPYQVKQVRSVFLKYGFRLEI
jgi:hypothetical protein